MKKVGIQGGVASFHEMAAIQFFPKRNDIKLVECHSFAQLVQQLESGEIDEAVMAIENTIAGNLLPNYSLIQRFNLKIIAETILPIELDLMCIENRPIESLRIIKSHPVALLQCHEFLSKYPSVRNENVDDTANGARLARKQNERDVGVIANKRAAELYDMCILAKSIQSAGNNQTRFFLLSKEENIKGEKEKNKASVCFQLHHHVGSLADVLMNCKYHQVNLTKILSLPIIGKTDEYNFYMDLTWNRRSDFNALINLLKEHVKSFQLLGQYKNVNFGR